MQRFRAMRTAMNSTNSTVTGLSTVSGQRTIRVGVGATPGALLIGASADVTVTWSSPFPHATYFADVSGLATLLGGGTCTIQSKTASNIVVRVTAGIALAAGVQFVVIAMC